MSNKILIFILSIFLFSNCVTADVTYEYSSSDILDPVIDSAVDTFNIDFYSVISIIAVIVIILAIVFASTIIKKTLFEPFKNKNVLNSNISNRKIKSIDPLLDVNGFKGFAFDTFKKYADAFSNLKYDELKEIFTDDLYNAKRQELESFKMRKLKNIILNVKLNYCQINDVKKLNDIEIVDVILTVSFNGYTASIYDPDTVMIGSKRDIQEETYLLTFTKKEAAKICSKCGGELQNNRCIYCRAENTENESNWLLDKMKVLKQKTIGK